MARRPGLEPRQKLLEGFVLPLHYRRIKMAPAVGLEPTILRLTAERITIMLYGNKISFLSKTTSTLLTTKTLLCFSFMFCCKQLITITTNILI